jgi:hypothetical protein
MSSKLIKAEKKITKSMIFYISKLEKVNYILLYFIFYLIYKVVS